MLRRALLFLAIAAGLSLGGAFAQSRSGAPPVTRPTWAELTDAQREALAPLAAHWDTLDEARKRKWLDIAGKFAKLTADGKARMHQRMAEFVRLTPQEKQVARENFKRIYELPSDQRESLLREYESLPDDKKRELEAQAKAKSAAKGKKPEPAR